MPRQSMESTLRVSPSFRIFYLYIPVVEKQEKKFRERNKKRKGDLKTKSINKDQAEDLHPSWAASKKAKQETKMVKFEGKKVTFDSDSD